MSRKIKTILIIILLIIIIIIGYLYFKPKDKENVLSSIYKTFNPFGTSSKIDTTGEIETEENKNQNIDTGRTLISSPRMEKLTDYAVSGASFLEIKKENSNIEAIRYVEKATGHIYERHLETKEIGKISNTTIPSINEALFGNNGSSIIYRYISEEKAINTFTATLGGTNGEFLPLNILEMSLSPDKNKFFYIARNSGGVTGSTGSFSEAKKSIVFNSPFSEWLPQWVTNQNIYLTTKPSYSVTGSVFNLNITNNTLTKLFGGVYGMTTLANKDGTLILYSSSTSNGPKLNLFNVKPYSFFDLDTYGLADKCVWSNDNINIYCAVPNTIVGTKYPDSWYQGLVSFDDFFVKINTQTKEKITILNSKDETIVDATNLFLDKNENLLFFINKKDSTLWSLTLK